MGYTLSEAGDRTGISHAYFSQIEHGDRPPPYELLEEVSRWRGTPVEVLLFGEEAEEQPQVAEAAPYIHVNRAAKIPIISRVAADADSIVAFDPVEPPSYATIPRGSVAFWVQGDSMQPVALDGQVVVFAPEPPEDGGLGLVELRDGRQLFKRIWQGDDRWILGSIQQTQPPMLIKPRQVRRCRAWVATIAGE